MENAADASGVVLVAALITATLALLTTVVERVWIAKDERKRWETADKRQVYAQFLSATRSYWTYQRMQEADPEGYLRRMEDFILKRSELTLVSPGHVQQAAGELFDMAMKGASDDANIQAFFRLESDFIEAARHDLSYRD